MEDLVKQYKAQIEALQVELQKKQKRIDEAEKIVTEMYNDLKKWKHSNLSKEQINDLYNTVASVNGWSQINSVH